MLRTIHVGLGTIGQEILRATVSTGRAMPLAGVDPLHAGKKLADLAGYAGLGGIIQASLDGAIRPRPDVAILSTASTVEALMPDLRTLIRAGINVVSTCEHLAYPWLRTPQLAVEINDLAHEHAVTVVGTGVNPGFLLDALPVFLTRPVVTIQELRVTRVVNTTRRRRQLQEKTGAGLSLEEFNQKAALGSIGHAGLAESAALICRGLGWKVPDQLHEQLEPVPAETAVATEHFMINPGMVRGQAQKITFMGPAGQQVLLQLKMALDEEEEYDEVIIIGEPPLHARLAGGVFGDTATAGCTVNILRQVVNAQPGLLTVLDLPPT